MLHWREVVTILQTRPEILNLEATNSLETNSTNSTKVDLFKRSFSESPNLATSLLRIALKRIQRTVPKSICSRDPFQRVLFGQHHGVSTFQECYLHTRLTEFSKKCSDHLQFGNGSVVLTNLEKYHQKLVPHPHKKRLRPFIFLLCKLCSKITR